MPVFDYWSWFRVCVKETKVAPSEFWKMDLIDMINLHYDESTKQPQDTSVMLNFERVLNGADKQWLRGDVSLQKH